MQAKPFIQQLTSHAETLWPLVIRKNSDILYRRERWATPDNDFIDLDWTSETCNRKQPLVVLFHGLEGNSRSHYCRAIMSRISQLGWTGVVPHFRSCSEELNYAPRLYHLGDTEHIDWIIGRLREHHPGPIYVIGVSLGGNVVLRWLGDRCPNAQYIRRAVAVCAPIDPCASAQAFTSCRVGMLYTRFFLTKIKEKALKKLDQYPGLFDRRSVEDAKSCWQFDSIVTVPIHGFKSVEDYWMRSAAKHVLHSVNVPTLLINTINDPLVPIHSLPAQKYLSTSITLCTPSNGGHVGHRRKFGLNFEDSITEKIFTFLFGESGS